MVCRRRTTKVVSQLQLSLNYRLSPSEPSNRLCVDVQAGFGWCLVFDVGSTRGIFMRCNTLFCSAFIHMLDAPERSWTVIFKRILLVPISNLNESSPSDDRSVSGELWEDPPAVEGA